VLTGTLDDFALTDVFRLISLARKTGELTVTRRAGHGRALFDGGDVVFAESSLVREPLGHKLVRAGVLTEGQLRRALDEQATTGRRLGYVLESAGTVSGRELSDALRGQTEDAVFDLLRWERGDFSWSPEEAVDVEVPIAVSVENLIMEAARRLDELDIIARKIPSVDVVLRMASQPPEEVAEINITPEEWRVLVLVDGARSVSDIAATVGLDEFAALRTLYGLVSAGLVEVISSGVGIGEVDSLRSNAPETGAALDQPSVELEREPEPREPGPEAVPAVEVDEASAEAGDEAGARDLASDQAMPSPGREQLASEAVGPVADAPPARWFEETPAGTGVKQEAPAEEGGGSRREIPRLDRAAVVRELAGLFREDEAAEAQEDEEAGAAGREPQEIERASARRRVEDDDDVTKSLIARLIDGVKGL
jgi:CBS domain-containing protein